MKTWIWLLIALTVIGGGLIFWYLDRKKKQTQTPPADDNEDKQTPSTDTGGDSDAPIYPLKEGSRNAKVLLLQKAMNKAADYPLIADSPFVKNGNFPQSIVEDGIWGEKTSLMLKSLRLTPPIANETVFQVVLKTLSAMADGSYKDYKGMFWGGNATAMQTYIDAMD